MSSPIHSSKIFADAIGVFDSGVGGLSVLRAIHDALPAENLVYVADSGHAPYGDKSEAYITQRTLMIGTSLFALILRQTSNPSKSGKPMSSNTMSQSCMPTACSPVVTC